MTDENPNDELPDEVNEVVEETGGSAADGAFISSLQRNHKQIRNDRAIAIGEDAQMMYKRTIEDLEVSVKRMQREQENLLDNSPDNALSLKLASDFNAAEYVDIDIKLAVKIRNTRIKLAEAKKRFGYLFGGE